MALRKYDITGQQFGNWLVIKELPKIPPRTRNYLCRCVCGTEKPVRQFQLMSGRSKGCGCNRTGRVTHGMTGTGAHRSWIKMRERCYSPKCKIYKYYGGRGIKICDRWMSFENFYADMGERPANTSIERRDNNKGYSPDNCYWADRIQQANNKRNNHFLTYKGKTQTVSEWGRELNLDPKLIFNRKYTGFTDEQALTSKLWSKVIHHSPSAK